LLRRVAPPGEIIAVAIARTVRVEADGQISGEKLEALRK
jgi:hypothetical protein